MRILWVEDLGGIEPDRLVAFLKDWLDDHEIDTLAEGLSEHIRHIKKDDYWITYYKDQKNILSDGREVHFCIHLSNLNEILSSRQTVSFFDVVLIDINLENDAFIDVNTNWPEGIETEKAGLWVYNRLVRMGFPPERLAFVTGNAVDAAKNFIDICRSNFIEPAPISFEKGSILNISDHDKKTEFQKWLTAIDDDFLLLRRGIIDGCYYICEELDNNGIDFVQFNRFCKNDSDAKMDIDTAKDYLSLLAITLPNKISPENTQFQLKILLRTIAHEWESEFHPKHISNDDNKKKDLVALGYVMKMARNLLAHGSELHNVEYKDFAYLFLINCRAMFLLGDELAPYEKILLELFEIEKNPQYKADLQTTYDNIKPIFLPYFNNPKKTRNGEIIEFTTHYNQRIQLLAYADEPPSNIEYTQELYRIFYHCLYPNCKHQKSTLPWLNAFADSFYNRAFRSQFKN